MIGTFCNYVIVQYVNNGVVFMKCDLKVSIKASI